jgi:Heparinase II/III-like protein
MKRREFLTLASGLPLFANHLIGRGSVHARDPQSPPFRPGLLIAEHDPFSGSALLRARYASGHRPPDDFAGLALSWKLTGEASFAEKALAQLKSSSLPAVERPGRTWIDFIQFSLAFDWLHGFPGFDGRTADPIAQHLLHAADHILEAPDLADPSEVSYHNYSLRYISLAAFALYATVSYKPTAEQASRLLPHVNAAFQNILDLTQLVTPGGSYHESMDYFRITWAPLAMLAELWRTSTGVDPAIRYTAFQSVGTTYLYKLMPDGTPSREGDNEYPILNPFDTTVLGYSVHRFKDPYAAWILRKSGFVPDKWLLPVFAFLWEDPEVVPRDPALSTENELPRQKYFPGVGHLVMRTGWAPKSTWIEFDSGPFFAKHQHPDQNQFTIYHQGYLAIDSGADYTDSESPHYLNYYHRTIAHNTILVFDPDEKFYWSENILPAANDGGQRMDSSRYWNTVRSLEDWERTRETWDLARMGTLDYVPGQYHYALGDATRAYSQAKLNLFTRQLLYDPQLNLLFVFDRLRTTRPDFHKVWLLHSGDAPVVDGIASPTGNGGEIFHNAAMFRITEGNGELLVHSLLPRERLLTRRGGPGYEFWVPGDDRGGPWGSGENWPMDPEQGSALPSDKKLQTMWKTFWGQDFSRILPSNHKNVKPGAWRMEVSPATAGTDVEFLHVIEIGERGIQAKHVEALEGVNVCGAFVSNGPVVLFANTSETFVLAEVTLPALPCQSLIATGLEPNGIYELNFSGPNIPASLHAASPGVPIKMLRARANEKGILRMQLPDVGNARLRISRS